ncbi:hypothetical protein BUALT_Bualt18G0085900 [Buddleja alternifolia]|uniref:non-specific serine/threonine protein kinase n=1 Tax=Buddleja alternifolia TaxID=168488 RepID=A0AAV6W9Q1_9LAMI|nr:hypothetical protein BUALT_Bualt18G0085900 [Buddleja alternifolia]
MEAPPPQRRLRRLLLLWLVFAFGYTARAQNKTTNATTDPSEGDDSLQSIGVRLDGKNYSYWSYVMINFLKGKGLWDYVSGKAKCPKTGDEKFDELFRVWEANNSKIITWINNSVEQRIGVQLAKFNNAKEIWDYLSRLFVQNNFVVKYQLQSEIRALVQNDLGIQDFFCAMTTLWDQLALTESVELQACAAYIKCRDEDRLVQLLMGLRPEFENCRSGLLHRKPLPSVEDVVFAAPTQQYKASVIGNCNYCKQPGHWKAQCPELRKASGWKPPQSGQGWKPPQSGQGGKPPQSGSQGRKPLQQHHGGQQKPYSGGQSQNFYTPTQAAFVPSIDHSASETSVSPNIDSVADQFQKFLAFQQFQSNPQSYALSAPSIGPGINSSSWILDSGAGNHMSPDSSAFISISSDPPSTSVVTADGTPMSLTGIGTIHTSTISLPDVYCIPKLHMNFASAGQICDSGCFVGLFPNSCYVQDLKSKRVIGTGRRKGKGLYVLDELHLPTHAAAMRVNLSSFHLTPSSSKFYLWHSRLGHVSGSRLRYMCTTGILGDLPSDDISDCSGCKLGKFSALPFNLSTSTSSAPFDLVHSDVWGPAPISTKGGSRYYVSFIDDYTRYCWVYLLKRRSDLVHTYTEFQAYVKTQHSATIKCFRADLGGEYTSGDLSGIFKADERTKLSSRVAICVFLGYGDGQKGYRCHDPVSGKLYVSRNVSFIEHVPFFSIPSTSHSMSKSDLVEIDPFTTDCTSDSTPISSVTSQSSGRSHDIDTRPPPTTIPEPLVIADPVPPRYPKRIPRSTQVSDYDYSCYSPSFASFLVSINSISRAVNSMFSRWRISATNQWNISGELCSGVAIGATDIANINPGIKCDCSDANGTTCHITALKVYALDVAGPLPDELWNLTFLTVLSVGINALSGELPNEIGQLTDLRSLYFDSAGFTGPIPSTFARLRSLERVWASDNELTGPIPDFIGSWSGLLALRLQGNSFQGSIPASFSNLTSLNDLRISDISNGSSSVDFLRNMRSLSTLVLRNNNVSGSIPSYFSEFQSLSLLFLGNNRLTGALPSQMRSTPQTIDLSYNELSGSFPSWVSRQNLQLNFVSNNFTINNLGSSDSPYVSYCLQRNFPCSRGSPRFNVINNSQNSFGIKRSAHYSLAVNCGGPQIRSSDQTVYEMDSHPLGPATYYMTGTGRLAVSNVGLPADSSDPVYQTSSSSQFTNTLDSELFQTARVSAGSLRYYGLGMENGNYTVRLQFAEIDILGNRTWRSLGRRVFDIYIQGNRVLRDFDIRREAEGVSLRAVVREFTVEVSGNYLEIHLFWAGKGTCCVPRQGSYGPLVSAISATPQFRPTRRMRSRTGMIVGIVVAVGVASLISLAASYYVFQKRRKQKNFEDEEISVEEIISLNFYSCLGNYGTLGDGRVIAVKQLSVASQQGKSQFVAEIATISAVQHRNLVKLYGCCIEGVKRLLVYEYLENRSLNQLLFGTGLRPSMSRVVAMLAGDIEVASVTTRPGYLTDWKFSDATTFETYTTDDISTSNPDTSHINSSMSTTKVAYSPVNPAKPLLHEIIEPPSNREETTDGLGFLSKSRQSLIRKSIARSGDEVVMADEKGVGDASNRASVWWHYWRLYGVEEGRPILEKSVR